MKFFNKKAYQFGDDHKSKRKPFIKLKIKMQQNRIHPYQ